MLLLRRLPALQNGRFSSDLEDVSYPAVYLLEAWIIQDKEISRQSEIPLRVVKQISLIMPSYALVLYMFLHHSRINCFMFG